MVALKIEEQKSFTSGLFLGDLFDRFLVREVNITTFNSFTIDEHILLILFKRHAYHTSAQLLKEKDVAEQKAVGATRVIHTRP